MKKTFTVILFLSLIFTIACAPEAQTEATPTPYTAESTATSVSTASPTSSPIAAKQMYVTGSSVNVRKSAGTNSDILTLLKRNSAVIVHRQENGWYYIEYEKDKFGYMSAAYLSDKRYIASANEQLDIISEFDFSDSYFWLDFPDNDDREFAFAVTDLNQNGRLELFLVSSYKAFTTKTCVFLYEINKEYNALELLPNIDGYDFDYSEADKSVNYWPDILTSFNTVYINDNKYYYIFSTGGKTPTPDDFHIGEYHLITLNGQYPTSQLLTSFRKIDGKLEYFDSQHNELTYEQHKEILNTPIENAVEKSYTIKWEYYISCGSNKEPKYNYSKATVAQRLDALKSSYEGFAIK